MGTSFYSLIFPSIKYIANICQTKHYRYVRNYGIFADKINYFYKEF